MLKADDDDNDDDDDDGCMKVLVRRGTKAAGVKAVAEAAIKAATVVLNFMMVKYGGGVVWCGVCTDKLFELLTVQQIAAIERWVETEKKMKWI